MYAWELKLASVLAIVLVMFGSYGYVSANVKNPNAPLQPEVAKPTAATPTPTPIPSLVGTRRGSPPRATASPAPRLNLFPGVQATSLPAVTFTHTS
jgi:hypothetical protein